MSQPNDAALQAIIRSLREPFERVFGILETAVETCPDDLWNAKCGGFRYWQQLYHVFAAIDFFIKDPGEPPTHSLYSEETARLLRDEPNPPSKAELLAFARVMCAAAVAFINALTMEALHARNESRSKRMGKEVDNLHAMVMLTGHGYFHVGACDSILRERGLPGLL